MYSKNVRLDGLVVPSDLVDKIEKVLRIPRRKIKGQIIPLLSDYIRLRLMRFPSRLPDKNGGILSDGNDLITDAEVEKYIRQLAGE